ncbi:MAG: hypothetical protein KatS3mg053_1873 [Candidatus Roseilinea sp.]|jgi:aryl-alcohol dehydrogenase-like predicted oxidoreductase|nr:hypothetical protein [Candidatus Roseilinea sp. NK_OTU-006]BCX03935.1 MAG: hypothetical protein KatS3mg053_1873 [Candidatus Roseilinea sp.]
MMNPWFDEAGRLVKRPPGKTGLMITPICVGCAPLGKSHLRTPAASLC